MTPLKKCTKCGEEKPATREFFFFRKDTNKWKNDCRSCVISRSRRYYQNNTTDIKNTNKTRYQANREIILKKQLEYRIRIKREPLTIKCPCCVKWFRQKRADQTYCSKLCRVREFHKKNTDYGREQSQRWRASNPDKKKMAANKYARREINDLLDGYIIRNIKKTVGKGPAEQLITHDFIEMNRLQIKARRLIKQQLL